MAATAPMGSPKLEPSAPLSLDHTGKVNVNLSDVKIQLLVARIGEVPKGDDESVSLREVISDAQESNNEGLSKSYKKHTKALYELIKILTIDVKSITSGTVANDPNEFDGFMDTSPREGETSASLQILQEKVAHLTGSTNQKVGREQFEELKRDVQLDQLLDKIMILEGQVIDESVKLDDYAFETQVTIYGAASHKDGFGNIPSYADWIGQDNESIKTRLNTYVRDYLEGVCGTISSSKKGGGLAHALLMKVMSQWTSFTSHIDAFYQELVYVSHFSPKTAFTLIGRLSNAIWAAMRPYRTRVALLGNMRTSHNKALYIWGVLQCY
eukprot:scaffold163882_cov51-Attheya_sp.AAC.1